MRFCFFVFLFQISFLSAQYRFSGEVSPENAGNAIYLSLVEDYRKSSRVYLDQIVKKVEVDSLGRFLFEGDNLTTENRMYRIHLDGCSEESSGAHFLGQCNNSKSVLFIANNTDTVQFPTSFEEQSLCTINSTNPKSSLLLEWEILKERMAYDFVDYPSETSKNLNMKKWFSELQNFGEKANEPLVELLIFDFLSDKRNETYSHYLQDVSVNPYYGELSNRLEQTYPDANFTQEYEAEISTDKDLATFNQPKIAKWVWVALLILVLSLLGNLYFFVNRRAKLKTHSDDLLQKLTPQEQKIVHYILLDKSNKEIASALFVSLSTVKTHINNLYKKLDISSREEIVLLFQK